MKKFIDFNLGMIQQPLPVVMWIMILMGANMIAPLFFLNQIEAKITMLTIMLNAMLMFGLFTRFGFTRILGLGHIFWVPLVGFLLTRLSLHSSDSIFGIWLRALIVINVISLIFDTIDVIRWLRGDKKVTTKTPS